MSIIGLSGKKQSGKNAIGDRLEEDGIAKQFAFADVLKRFCCEAFNIPKEDLWGTDSDKNKPTIIRWGDMTRSIIDRHKLKEQGYEDCLTVRQVLQIFGTDICREGFYDNIWINLAMSKVKNYRRTLNHLSHEVITDVRFPNEGKMIKDNDGIIIRLLRNSNSGDGHISEKSMDDFPFDYVIDNRYLNLDEQYQAVLDILEKEGIYAVH